MKLQNLKIGEIDLKDLLLSLKNIYDESDADTDEILEMIMNQVNRYLNELKRPTLGRQERQIIIFAVIGVALILTIMLSIVLMVETFYSPPSRLDKCLKECPEDSSYDWEDLECPKMCYDYFLLNKSEDITDG